ncbi:MAG TPA: CDP-alcohol phosphatidyltransferase family protein [Bacteroidota bacterium]|nr:CDP-alcohol phosphatidyltransferase family protein [Bacteroidota bacterium]
MTTHSFLRLYRLSVKSAASDELVNTYLQRPAAACLTYALAFTTVTPNQVTFVSTVFGIALGVLLALPTPEYAAAALCAWLKDVFDSADGQLARATGRLSRRGRFWDSIGDFAVNTALFIGLGSTLVREGHGLLLAALASTLGWLSVNLRVSYQVFYQTSYLHAKGSYMQNRVTEEVRAEDTVESDRVTLVLQKIFQVMYGWQDRLTAAIDRRCRRRAGNPPLVQWYEDNTSLRLNRLFGMGTDFVTLTVCLAVRNPDAYLIVSLVAFNLLWTLAVAYRFFFALRTSASSSK